jgi:hypothetical protein
MDERHVHQVSGQGVSVGLSTSVLSRKFLNGSVRGDTDPVDLGVAAEISVIGAQQTLDLISSQPIQDPSVPCTGSLASAASVPVAFRLKNPNRSLPSLALGPARRIGGIPRLFASGVPPCDWLAHGGLIPAPPRGAGPQALKVVISATGPRTRSRRSRNRAPLNRHRAQPSRD